MTSTLSLMLYIFGVSADVTRFVALAQTYLNISVCISEVVEVSMHKFTNENIFPEAIQKTVLPHRVR